LPLSINNKNTEGRWIPPRLCHSIWTAWPSRLPHSARGPHIERSRESFRIRVRKPRQ
jgi:hypothetical protein